MCGSYALSKGEKLLTNDKSILNPMRPYAPVYA